MFRSLYHRYFFFNTAILLSSVLTGCLPSENNIESPPVLKYFDQGWANHKLWDDGSAEVSVYKAERVIYGKVRPFEYTYILVKETFNQAYHVKTTDYNRDDLFEVMKLNMFADIQTENYPYHFLTSLFFRREQPTQVYKMTSSSQEWCGQTFKLFTNNPHSFIYTYHSYWDQEGEGKKTIAKDIFFEDQLPYTLRTLAFQDSIVFQYPVMGTQVNTKAQEPEIYQASFIVNQETDSLALSHSTEKNVWKVTVKLDQHKVNKYWFSVQYPHYLLRQKTWDGRNLSLKHTARRKYWVE